jgi:hypothetical protein
LRSAASKEVKDIGLPLAGQGWPFTWTQNWRQG